MWMATKFGFYSIVQTENRKDLYMVRAREKRDLLNLVNNLMFLSKRKVRTTYDTDYFYRIFVNKEELDIILIFLSNELDYSNFKDKIAEVRGQKNKVPYYSKIWGIMFDYQFDKNKTFFNYGRYFRNNKKNKRNRKSKVY